MPTPAADLYLYAVIIAKPLSARYPALILCGNNIALEQPSVLSTEVNRQVDDQRVAVRQNYQHEGRKNGHTRVSLGSVGSP